MVSIRRIVSNSFILFTLWHIIFTGIRWSNMKLVEFSGYEVLSEQNRTYPWQDLLHDAAAVNKTRNKAIPVIYVITPTHTRLQQKADLTRFAQTLLHVKQLHWILVEDSLNKTDLVTNFLAGTSLNYTHLNVATSSNINIKGQRGTLQRNAALDWIRAAVRPGTEGAVYFADDDNTYDIRIFEEMRYTKTISVWPVGLVATMKYESPIVKEGHVTGWRSNYLLKQRKFALDMAGFAVSLKLVVDHPGISFQARWPSGFQESNFLSQFNITLDEFEPKADNCTKVLVWHTRTSIAGGITGENKIKGNALPPPVLEV